MRVLRVVAEQLDNGVFVTITTAIREQRLYCSNADEAGKLVATALTFSPTEGNEQFDAVAALELIKSAA